jgi:hypothetical protein
VTSQMLARLLDIPYVVSSTWDAAQAQAHAR